MSKSQMSKSIQTFDFKTLRQETYKRNKQFD